VRLGPCGSREDGFANAANSAWSPRRVSGNGEWKMYELIELALTRIRAMADLADEALLAYMIDIAIIEATARSNNSSLESLIAAALEPQDSLFAN
jgi:hypothetical protein